MVKPFVGLGIPFLSRIPSTMSENSLPLMPTANGVELNSLNVTMRFTAKGWRGEITKHNGSDRRRFATNPVGLLSESTTAKSSSPLLSCS